MVPTRTRTQVKSHGQKMIRNKANSELRESVEKARSGTSCRFRPRGQRCKRVQQEASSKNKALLTTPSPPSPVESLSAAAKPTTPKSTMTMAMAMALDQMRKTSYSQQAAEVSSPPLVHLHHGSEQYTELDYYNSTDAMLSSTVALISQAMTQNASNEISSYQPAQVLVLPNSVTASNVTERQSALSMTSNNHPTQLFYSVTSSASENQATPSVSNTTSSRQYLTQVLVHESNYLTSASSNQQAATQLGPVYNLNSFIPDVASSRQATGCAPISNTASYNHMDIQSMGIPSIVATTPTTNQIAFQRSVSTRSENQGAMQMMYNGDTENHDEVISLNNSIHTGIWSALSSPMKSQDPPPSSVSRLLVRESHLGVDLLERYYLDSNYISGFPTKYDVLCDPVNDVYCNHVGNRRLRIMAMTSLREYMASSSPFFGTNNVMKKREDIHRTRRFILEFMHSLSMCDPPCRFLSMDVTVGRWRELNGDYSRMKVQETFRECKEIMEESSPVDGRLRF